MNDELDQVPPRGGGLGGTLRLIAVTAVTLLAIVTLLVVFGVIPRSVFRELTNDLLFGVGILVAASVAIGLLMGRRKS